MPSGSRDSAALPSLSVPIMRTKRSSISTPGSGRSAAIACTNGMVDRLAGILNGVWLLCSLKGSALFFLPDCDEFFLGEGRLNFFQREKVRDCIFFKCDRSGRLKKIQSLFSLRIADHRLGFFLLLPEGVVRIDNRGKSTREHRDQDEPDGKIRNQRPGTAHDTCNFE